jgi:septal ring factor EnvC (AmiA/AmiB activator)
MPGDAPLSVPDFHYGLPVTARVADGLGSVSRSGIVSRGVQFDTARGSPVVAPADGTVAFAAPFRGQDGLVIIDHGKGWTTLLLGVASDKRRGTRVARGESIGRTLGPVGVELRRDGKPVSPAFIAASSPPLSNSAKSR